MIKILKFEEFLSEAEMSVSNPSKAGEEFAKILSKHKDVKESPMGSNKGPEVNQYLQSTGLPGGYPWCMAFVYAMFEELSKSLGVSNPLIKTAGVRDHWGKADSSLKIGISEVRKNPNLVRPGQIFIMSRPGVGNGHTGIVISVDPSSKTITTIEGNTNDQSSGEGHRVGINKRNLDSTPLLGFIDYFKSKRSPEFEAGMVRSLNPAELQKLSTLPPSGSSQFPESGVATPIGQEKIESAWKKADPDSFDAKFAKFKEFLSDPKNKNPE